MQLIQTNTLTLVFSYNGRQFFNKPIAAILLYMIIAWQIKNKTFEKSIQIYVSRLVIVPMGHTWDLKIVVFFFRAWLDWFLYEASLRLEWLRWHGVYFRCISSQIFEDDNKFLQRMPRKFYCIQCMHLLCIVDRCKILLFYAKRRMDRIRIRTRSCLYTAVWI